MNKQRISYLLIILAFALLVFAIYIFFRFKIKAIEKDHQSIDLTTKYPSGSLVV